MIQLPPKLATLEQAVIQRFKLDLEGMYGQAHWRRVLRNGILIAEADPDNVCLPVVCAFAFLHDAARETEQRELGHGPAASRLTQELFDKGVLDWLDKTMLTQLRAAVCDHPLNLQIEQVSRGAATLNACWDAAKLDLPRMGVTPAGLKSVYALQPGVVERHVAEAWNPDDPNAMIGDI